MCLLLKGNHNWIFWHPLPCHGIPHLFYPCFYFHIHFYQLVAFHIYSASSTNPLTFLTPLLKNTLNLPPTPTLLSATSSTYLHPSTNFPLSWTPPPRKACILPPTISKSCTFSLTFWIPYSFYPLFFITTFIFPILLLSTFILPFPQIFTHPLIFNFQAPPRNAHSFCPHLPLLFYSIFSFHIHFSQLVAFHIYSATSMNFHPSTNFSFLAPPSPHFCNAHSATPENNNLK